MSVTEVVEYMSEKVGEPDQAQNWKTGSYLLQGTRNQAEVIALGLTCRYLEQMMLAEATLPFANLYPYEDFG